MALRRMVGKRVAGKEPSKAKTVGGPLPAKPDAQLAGLSAQQVVAEVKRRQEVAIGNMYAMALCLRDLARPERYRGELGFASFEAMLAAHPELPSRMTCHKWFTVVSTYTEVEVRQLGGMEKCYQLIRVVREHTPARDPRDMLEKNATILGAKVSAISARGLRELVRGKEPTRKVDTTPAKRAARRLRTVFRRLLVTARLRAHAHDGKACVETHFPVPGATMLADLLKGAVPLGAT